MTRSYKSNSTKILWTGGWDSTFRLLQLIAERGVHVEPYYIIDTRRASALVEIKTMSRLRSLIKNKIPDASQLIGKFRFFPIDEIKDDAAITQSFQSLKSEAYLGSQYDWLARFASQQRIENLELAIHRDDKAYTFIEEFVTSVNDPVLGHFYELKTENLSSDVRNLFRFYRFPLLKWSKPEMEEHAREQGYIGVMNETWFCHKPVRNRPCGICKPCQYAIEEGMAKRLPYPAILRNKFKPFYDIVKFIEKGWRYTFKMRYKTN